MLSRACALLTIIFTTIFFVVSNIDVATEEAGEVDGSGAAEPGEVSEEETDEEGSGELAEKRSGIQEDVNLDIHQDSE